MGKKGKFFKVSMPTTPNKVMLCFELWGEPAAYNSLIKRLSEEISSEKGPFKSAKDKDEPALKTTNFNNGDKRGRYLIALRVDESSKGTAHGRMRTYKGLIENNFRGACVSPMVFESDAAYQSYRSRLDRQKQEQTYVASQ